MSEPCDVLLVAKDFGDTNVIPMSLAQRGFTCVVAPDARHGWELIVQHRPKVILSDWDMPGTDGLDLCRRVRGALDLMATYFVMVTSSHESVHRESALQSGVDDYLFKPIDRSILMARVRLGIRMWDINERLHRAAITDGLTGLYNHDHLNTIIERELNRARRYGGCLGLIMLDLDHFKAINDTYGHLTGNQTLVEIARILTETVRDVDTVGRFGGEEFAVVVPETSAVEAVAICERIRLGVRDTLNVDGLQSHVVTASLGVATADDPRVRSATDLIDLADRALYRAKRRGRNCVVTAQNLREDDSSAGIEHQEVECLRKRIAVLSVRAKEVYIQTISSLLQALEEKDPFTARHSLNVSHYCQELADIVGVNEAHAVTIRNAGLLHDVGKVGVPDRILMKHERLTDLERMVMRQVPAISVRIIDHLRILESEMQIIRHQSEHYDGSGYPDGLHREQIPIGSRILLVANAFDAITTDRVYRDGRSIDEAIRELRELAGKQFDPGIVDALEKYVRTYRSDIETRVRETADMVRSPTGVY